MNDIQIIQTTRHIVFYDGECGLCQRSVQWLLNRDKKKILFYAPLQGETAKELLTSIEFPEGLDSIIYLQEEEGHNIVKWYSNAFLDLLRVLPFPWFLGRIFILVPRFIRDAVYRFIAKNRIKWFGRADACRLPTEEEQLRFLP